MDLDSREALLAAPRCGLQMFPLCEFFTYLPRLPTHSTDAKAEPRHNHGAKIDAHWPIRAPPGWSNDPRDELRLRPHSLILSAVKKR